MLVVASFGHRFVQLCRFVAGFLVDFQEADSESRGCEHGDVEFEADGRFDPVFVLETAAEKDLTLKETFKLSLEFFDSPHYGAVLGFVLGPSD